MTACTETRTEFGLIPECGAVPNLPAEVYHKYDAASNSRLTAMDAGECHLYHQLQFPKEPTAAMQEGTALHALVLEPPTFYATYLEGPDVDKKTNVWKAAKADAENIGRILLDASTWEKLHRMRDAIDAHPTAGALLRRCAIRELSLFWDCPDSGIRCKARLDAIGPVDDMGMVICDLKKTRDASPAEFQKAIWNYGYFRQGPMYIDGYNALNAALNPDAVPAKHFVFIAIEAEPPYALGVYRLSDEPGNDVVAAGRGDLHRLKMKYKHAREDWAKGITPAGYNRDIIDVGLPSWAMRELGI